MNYWLLYQQRFVAHAPKLRPLLHCMIFPELVVRVDPVSQTITSCVFVLVGQLFAAKVACEPVSPPPVPPL